MIHILMKRTFLLSAVFLSSLIMMTACKSKKEEVKAPPAFKVMEIRSKKVPVYIQVVGQAVGIPTVEIRARVAGYLRT